MGCYIVKSIYPLVLLIFVHLSRGDDDNISTSEKAALLKFRALASNLLKNDDYTSTDDYLVRYLRAKEMNLEDAVEMFSETLKWRRRNRISSIVNETILTFNPKPYVIDGYDREGNPLLIFTPTHVDLRKLIIQGLRDKVVRYFFQMLERGQNAIINAPNKANGRNVTQATVILDLHGYNLKQHFCLDCISVYTEWFVGLEKYYPEGMRHFVLVNVPRIAKQLMELIVPLLSPNSVRGLKIIEPDRKQWVAYLLKLIAPDQLPPRFGGTKKSPK